MSALARLEPAPFARGSVWLVGAGPGDPGLLTLHAVSALDRADVVLHDALVSPAILALATTPRLEAVGKRAGRWRTPQIRINERLIALAKQGLRVLRLKGGDPTLFGRGGEEALALAAAGVPFRLVPGVTAGLAGPALAGIPVTHRGLARSVAFVTARAGQGGVPRDLDFAALARGAETLIFFMALSAAAPLATALMAAGRNAADAAAFIVDASLPSQRVTLATLATAAEVAAGLPRDRPTLIVIGPPLALRDVLAPLQQIAPMRLAEPRGRAAYF